ncbi:MAG: hypothetical protein Q8O51_02460 [bacterium]|nr:hypothetical protein [bacterium]
MAETLARSATRFVFRELVVDVLFFPAWWYGKGLVRVGAFTLSRMGEFTNRSRWSPKVWFQNLFVPMYGDYSRSGRAISFFVRLIVGLALTVVLVVTLAAYALFFLGYLTLPIGVVYFFLRQLVSLPWPTL